MPDYSVFGGCLRSELTFPELAPANGRVPNWTLRLGTLSRTDDAEVLSEVVVFPTCRVRLTRGEGWFRYSHSCTGSFEVFAKGRRVLFEQAPHGDLDGARTDFVSRVLPYCVDNTSLAWLQGSAVRIAGDAIAFLGGHGSGKSTIALALSRAGADHICDDTLPVETGTKPVIRPSDDVIRVSSDSRTQLALSASAVRRESDGKFVMTRRALGSTGSSSSSDAWDKTTCSLAAVYLLTSKTPVRNGAAASRRLVSPGDAIPLLAQHSKLETVMNGEAPGRLAGQLRALARAVPVYELTVSRDWTVIGEVVERLNSWHAQPSVRNRELVSV